MPLLFHLNSNNMIKRTLYFGNSAYLSMKNKQLVVKIPEVENNKELPDFLKREVTKTIPIEDIGLVVIDNKQVTFTSGLVDALLESGSAFVVCDSKSMPSGMLLPLNGNTLQSERFTAQIEASQPLKKQLWQQTVAQKIANQSSILKHNTNAETGCMDAWSKQVKSGDSDNLEARAAAYYWRNIFPSIPEFLRDREGLPPNNLLNYGYAILRAVVARSLVGSGLLPTLGIHHHNRYNAYCLADDIMEPYRPFVDQVVINILNSKIKFEEISKEIKSKLLSIPTLDVVVKGKRSPLMVAMSLTTSSLAKCYLGELRKIEYPIIEY